MLQTMVRVLLLVCLTVLAAFIFDRYELRGLAQRTPLVTSNEVCPIPRSFGDFRGASATGHLLFEDASGTIRQVRCEGIVMLVDEYPRR
jgi:hypothetical protein